MKKKARPERLVKKLGEYINEGEITLTEAAFGIEVKPKVMIVQYFALGISAMKHSGFLAFLVRLSLILSSPHPSKYCLQYLRTIPLNMNL